jgi:hypothetical protein
MSLINTARKLASESASFLKRNQNTVFLVVATLLSLYILARANPFNIPTIDDSAIVMRYLKNFQAGHFFVYNAEDGPVYGVSGFIHGLIAGILCWFGLDPKSSIMIVSLVGCIGMFYCVLRIMNHASRSIALSVIGTLVLYFSSFYLPATLFLGLEVPVNLWLVSACFLYFLEQRSALFYLCGVLAIVSKLDTLSLVAGLLGVNMLRAHLARELRTEFRRLIFWFIIPLLAWIAFSTAVFGSPLPESFLSKFYFREKAPHTSWFPFIEPMIVTREQRISLILMLAAMLLSPVIAFLRRKLFLPSLLMAAAAVGTLILYFVYNPGEKMPWYYPLPELMMLLAVVLCALDAFRIPSFTPKAAISLVTLAFCFTVLAYRLPANMSAASNARYWQIVYESERRDTGVLANAIKPKDHPVLWTGHGYPAYMFDGFVADYSGLNTRAIWAADNAAKTDQPEAHAFFKRLGISDAPVAFKAQMYLIDMYHANVFMQHSLFSETVQKALRLRLAGSFYTIDLVNVPAFRVFVKDPDHARVVRSVAIRDVQAIGNSVKTSELYVSGASILISALPRSQRLLFGIKITPEDQNILVDDENGARVGHCNVGKILDPRYADGVRACEIPLSVGSSSKRLTIKDESGRSITLFEPAFETDGD